MFARRSSVVASRQRRSLSPVRGVKLQPRKMDSGESARKTEEEEEASSPGSRRADVRLQRRIAALSSPALPGARLTLPGVMDAEGRVDESRLRMHIFKNGRGILTIDTTGHMFTYTQFDDMHVRAIHFMDTTFHMALCVQLYEVHRDDRRISESIYKLTQSNSCLNDYSCILL